jgi:hypothetical protein
VNLGLNNLNLHGAKVIIF